MGHPKFEIKKTKKEQFMFNLTTKNGQVILSSEQYTAKAACKNGIDSVKTNAGIDDRYQRKEAKNGDVYFVLTAANHQVIGTSEIYKSKSSMENGISSVKENASKAEIDDTTA